MAGNWPAAPTEQENSGRRLKVAVAGKNAGSTRNMKICGGDKNVAVQAGMPALQVDGPLA
jgi:hypothetical protein